MQKKKLSVVSIVFFVLAGLILAFSIWAAVYSFDYISSLVEAGQLIVEGSEFELVNFHMSSYGQYVIFALIFFGLGWILYSMPKKIEEDFDFEDELDLDVDEEFILEDQEEPVEDFEKDDDLEDLPE